MSTSAISPVSSIDFASSSATSSEQAVFASLLNQLQQAVTKGDLNGTATLVNAVEALSPSSAGASSPLGTFLTSLGTALRDGSVSEAQAAQTVYLNAASSTTTAPASPSTGITANANEIAEGLIQSQIQLSLVTALLGPGSSFGSNSASDASGSSSNSANSLIGLLQAAYPTVSGSAAATPATASATPYDTLVSSIQASLAGGHGTITPALAYLQAAGNFVNTTA